MKKRIDLKNWSRKEHFDFFKKFDQPYYSITTEIDCTKAYHKAKNLGTSFFIYYLHKSILAVNKTEAFRYRIENDIPILFDVIDASATINRSNKTFGFSYLPFSEDYKVFETTAIKEIERVKQSNKLLSIVKEKENNVIHYSSIPWIRFTSLTHAQQFDYKEGIPKISFGKLTDVGFKKMMPVCIHVHHALVDAIDIATHLDYFQNLLDQ